MIVGMIKPNRGVIRLDDRDVTHEPMYRRARMGIGYLPQEASVFRRMTVEENILSILETLPGTKASRTERAYALLEELGRRPFGEEQGLYAFRR